MTIRTVARSQNDPSQFVLSSFIFWFVSKFLNLVFLAEDSFIENALKLKPL